MSSYLKILYFCKRFFTCIHICTCVQIFRATNYVNAKFDKFPLVLPYFHFSFTKTKNKNRTKIIINNSLRNCCHLSIYIIFMSFKCGHAWNMIYLFASRFHYISAARTAAVTNESTNICTFLHYRMF